MTIAYEDVEKRFTEKGLKLLTTKENYRRSSEKLAFLCLTHPYDVQPGITFNKLKTGYGCLTCAAIGKAHGRRTPNCGLLFI